MIAYDLELTAKAAVPAYPYLLKPPDPRNGEVVDSSVEVGPIWVEVSDHMQLGTSIGAADLEVLNALDVEGKALEIDTLAGALLHSIKDGR